MAVVNGYEFDKLNNDSKKTQDDNDRLKYISFYKEIAKTIRQKYAILIVAGLITVKFATFFP